MAGDVLGRREKFATLAGQLGTPLYVFDEQLLIERCERLKQAFAKFPVPVSAFYAVKSNNHPYVSKALVSQGIGLDISSGLELALALEAGAREIIFTGPGKTASELEAATSAEVQPIIWLDSLTELKRLAGAAQEAKTPVRIGARLNIQPDGLWRKFGIDINELVAFIHKAQLCPFLDFCGIHFHSSWNMDARAQTAIIESLGAKLSPLPEPVRQKIRIIDIGGGYWPEPGELCWADGEAQMIMKRGLIDFDPAEFKRTFTPAVPIEQFAQELGDAVEKYLGCLPLERVFIEPGRWLCSDSMSLIMRVTDKKMPDLVITDAGTNAIGWERFESDVFPVVNLTRPQLTERPCHLLGSLCTPHDVWGFSYFGAAIEEGDLLLVPSQGAYTWSLRQEFIKPVPKVCRLG
jgi:diaminopimelate decarboxylase